MLCHAPVSALRKNQLTKAEGIIVVCMRHYPRGLRRNLVHEYHQSLAPDAALFSDFREALKKYGDHNEAFHQVHYESRFTLDQKGLNELKRLSELSHSKDVHFICQCEKNEKCHRHLLLLAAKNLFGASIDKIHFEYPEFKTRLLKSRLAF